MYALGIHHTGVSGRRRGALEALRVRGGRVSGREGRWVDGRESECVIMDGVGCFKKLVWLCVFFFFFFFFFGVF